MASTAEARIDYISDRQELFDEMLCRRAGLDCYMLDRLDMFWVELDASTYSVDASIDSSHGPDSKVTWSLSHEYGPDTPELRARATASFSGSEQERKQETWMRALETGGYFEDGCWPGKDTYECLHCRSRYKNGSTHEHMRFDGRVIPHPGRKYREIQEAGLKVSWRPGATADEPSLEELGEL